MVGEPSNNKLGGLQIRGPIILDFWTETTTPVRKTHALGTTAAAAAKSLQSCPTLCDPRDGSPPGSPIPGILQEGTLEWVAISFSNAGKWKVKVKSLSHTRLLETPWTAAYQAPPSVGFSRQEYWSGVPLPSPDTCAIATYTCFSAKSKYQESFSLSNLEQLLSKIFRADSENPEHPERLSFSKFVFLARLSTMGPESWRPSRLRFPNLEQWQKAVEGRHIDHWVRQVQVL